MVVSSDSIRFSQCLSGLRIHPHRQARLYSGFSEILREESSSSILIMVSLMSSLASAYFVRLLFYVRYLLPLLGRQSFRRDLSFHILFYFYLIICYLCSPIVALLSHFVDCNNVTQLSRCARSLDPYGRCTRIAS